MFSGQELHILQSAFLSAVLINMYPLVYVCWTYFATSCISQYNVLVILFGQADINNLFFFGVILFVVSNN